MGFQSKHTYCSKTFTTGPSKIDNVVCQMGIKLNPEKTKVIIFSRSILARKTELNLKLHGETIKIYSQVKFPGITFDSQLTFKKHFGHPGSLQYQVLPFKAFSQQKVGT